MEEHGRKEGDVEEQEKNGSGNKHTLQTGWIGMNWEEAG